MPELFDNKLFLKTFLALRGIAQAETVAVIGGGRILVEPLTPRARYVEPSEFARVLAGDGGAFVAKPQSGTRGDGLFLIRRDGDRLVRQRGRAVSPYVPDPGMEPMLVERAIEQGEFWQALSPASCNTMRIVTMWTPGEARPFIGFAVQRMGTAATAPTDNWSGGGICAPIDLESGRLGVGRMHPVRGDRQKTSFEAHPDTGARILDAMLPHWDRVRATVLAAAASLPTNRYVGWDVAVDHAGVPVIVEGNSNTDVNLLQVHGGLLRDARVRRFYEACGVL